MSQELNFNKWEEMSSSFMSLGSYGHLGIIQVKMIYILSSALDAERIVILFKGSHFMMMFSICL